MEALDDNVTTSVSPTDICICLPVEEESTEICFGVAEGVEAGVMVADGDGAGLGDTAGVAVAAGAVTATIIAVLD